MPVDSGWPASRFAALLDNGAQQNQNQLDADLQGWLSEEHKANGEHGAVVADSVTLNPPNPADPLTGKLVVQDEDEKTTAIYRTRALSTVIDMMYGAGGSAAVATLFRYLNSSGVFTSLARIGLIQHGSASDPGIALLKLAATIYSDWAIVSGQGASSNPELIIGNLSTGVDPFGLRYRSSVPAYELMKHVGSSGPTTEEVNLGSDFDSSAQGFFNKTFTRRLKMQSVANASEWVGEWQNVAFSAGNFTANGAQTWTVASGDQAGYRWTMIGSTMTLAFYLNNTSVGGTPDVQLRIAIPGGYTAAGLEHNSVFISDNGTLGIGQAIAVSGNAFIAIYKANESAWSASTDNTAVRGQITFAIA